MWSQTPQNLQTYEALNSSTHEWELTYKQQSYTRVHIEKIKFIHEVKITLKKWMGHNKLNGRKK